MQNIEVQEYLTQGAVLAGQGKHEDALNYYDKAEKLDQMNIDIYISKGIALANLDRLSDAKAQFEKALKVNRSSGLAYFHLGSISILQGDNALGFEYYNKAVANGYDDAQLYYSLGLLHEENGEVDMAIRNYSKAIQRDALRPDIRLRKARLLIQGNHYPEALQALDEMILTNPDVFEGYHLKFSVLLQMKQYAKAEEVLNSALDLFPKDFGFKIDKVTLLVEQKKTDDALALLTELETDSDIEDFVLRRIYMERAQIFAAQEDVKSAIAVLEKAKALSDDSKSVSDDWVFDTEVAFLLVNCHLATEEYDRVLDYAKQIFDEADEGYYKETARYFIPLALNKLGRKDEALPLYKEAIDEYRSQALASPGNLDSYLLRIMALRDIEENSKALELVDYVINLQPERPEPRLLRVTILEALGRDEEAAQEAKTVNALLPDEMKR